VAERSEQVILKWEGGGAFLEKDSSERERLNRSGEDFQQKTENNLL
jgi:hypothetical protein